MSEPRYPTTRMCNGAILEAFEPTTRDTDVFCATVAKSGQTWLLTLLHHLKTRGHDPDLSGKHLLDVTPWLEIPNAIGKVDAPEYELETRLAEIEALSDPRIFKLHVVYDEIPKKAGSKAKIITITRDPRELPYSMFCHIQGLKKPASETPADFDAYFEKWMEFGFFFRFVHTFWPHRDDEDLLWLQYEEMQRDLPTQARRIVDFLGWDVDDDDIARVRPLVDFAYMQEREHTTLMRGARGAWKQDARFFREGDVGKNRSRLSPEQDARIVERARAEFEPACVERLLALGV